MTSAEKELRRAIPDGDDNLRGENSAPLFTRILRRSTAHLITRVKRLEWLLIEASESEISNLDLTRAVHEDVGGL